MTILDFTTIVGFFLAIISIFLVFYSELKRRPFLKVIPADDKITDNDREFKRMWYHLKAINEELKTFNRIFNRDSALQCIARIDFLDKNTLMRLIDQIEAHWTNLPEPRSGNKFEYTLVTMCKRMDIGFREESFDVLIKFKGDKYFYAADPWTIYPCLYGDIKKDSEKMQKMKINKNECIIRVEFEAINMGKRYSYYFNLKNNCCNLEMNSIEISLLDRRYYKSLEKKYQMSNHK